MAKLIHRTTKLLAPRKKLSANRNCCCHCVNVLLIAVYNSNCARDDTFNVTLNGNLLGSIDNTVANCSGRIFYMVISDTGPGPLASNVAAIACDCSKNFQASASFTSAILLNGVNALRVTSSDEQDNGNFGIMWVGCVSWDTQQYATVQVLLNSTYGHVSGVGNFTERSFNY